MVQLSIGSPEVACGSVVYRILGYPPVCYSDFLRVDTDSHPSTPHPDINPSIHRVGLRGGGGVGMGVSGMVFVGLVLGCIEAKFCK